MSVAGGESWADLCAWGIGTDEAATYGYFACWGLALLLADRKVLSGFDEATPLLACL